MIKFIETLLTKSLIFCLILSVLGSTNASTNIILMYSGESSLIIHNSHKLAPILSISSKKPSDWHTGLTKQGYSCTHSTKAKINVTFYEDYGGWFSQGNSQEAALRSWRACDESFDNEIIKKVKSHIEQLGASLTDRQVRKIKDNLNSGRGNVRSNGTINKFEFSTLDETRICKFHLTTMLKNETISFWSCNRHKASMTAELDMSIYKFLG